MRLYIAYKFLSYIFSKLAFVIQQLLLTRKMCLLLRLFFVIQLHQLYIRDECQEIHGRLLKIKNLKLNFNYCYAKKKTNKFII